MAVEWMKGDGGEKAVEEAAYAGMRSMEELVRLFSQNPTLQKQTEEEEEETEEKKSSSVVGAEDSCMNIANTAVAKFRKVISLLDRKRTGHARFRRSPALAKGEEEEGRTMVAVKEEEKIEERQPVKVYCPKPIQRLPPLPQHHNHPSRFFSAPATVGKAHGSALTGSTLSSSAFKVTRTTSVSTTQMEKRCEGGGDESGIAVAAAATANCSSATAGGSCHCSKKKKSKVRRTVRVPSISAKLSDIPSDEFSWRKYGQKPIKGSPHPRGYYKCSTVRGCPARKHVERAVDDPALLIVTYEGEHNHINQTQISTIASTPPTDGSPPPQTTLPQHSPQC